jgi:uncharacterized membrane protein
MEILVAATPVFLASIVEMVEAFTITLAVGVTRGWRSALLGMGSALVVLVAISLWLGPHLLEVVDEHALQLVIGTLLLLFGTRWLRKSLLRYGGVLPLHDEAKVFAAEVADLSYEVENRRRMDWPGFFISFKGTLIEGLEVVFLILTLGAVGDAGPLPAVLGAVAAFVLVAGVVAVVHRPLTRIPENTLKFAVGVVITGFGMFWLVEGLGGEWPGDVISLLVVFAAMLVMSLVSIRVIKTRISSPSTLTGSG